jgi:hypothetical protein
MAWLDDHPPATPQFRCPRREDPSGTVVVHTAENAPDFVAFDGGAEAVASWITRRTTPGSYHHLADSDSVIQLVRYECEAFHDGTGSNRWSYGVSAATRADVWPLAPQAWRDGCVRNMATAAASYARWLRVRSGIIIPARRISRADSEARRPGFTSHAERDPGRRSDPGAGFPWAQFFAEFARQTGAAPVPNPDEIEDDMFLYSAPGEPVFFCDGGVSVGLNEATDMKTFTDQKLKHFKLDDDTFAKFRTRFPGA